MEIFLVFIITGIICAIIAASKGRNVVGWFILGCMFSLLAVVVIACLSSNKEMLVREEVRVGKLKKCPECAELIKAEAIVCRFCRATFHIEPKE